MRYCYILLQALKYCVVDKILVLLLLLQKKGENDCFFHLFSGNSYSGDKPSSVDSAKRCLSSEFPQWGYYEEKGSLSTAHSFPISFPSACYGIVATHNPHPHTDTKYWAWATNNINGTTYLDKFVCGLSNDLDDKATKEVFIVAIGK